MNAEPSTGLSLSGLRKSYGEIVAVDGLDLEIPTGSTCALLGPSGCGKTTTLRLIAGLETPDAGEIRLGGELLNGPGRFTPPERRRIGMVFQDYALFPHLDVAANVGYGLGRRPDRARVEEALRLVGMEAQAGRAVHELSGGQQQRVALARALAPNPQVVLLDEPFSNLDAGLRERLRLEVGEILREAGVTAVFVTHDQEEALSVAEHVAVMREGRVEHSGSPEEVYSRPQTRWVAGFLGEVEILPATVEDGRARCELGSVICDHDSGDSVEVLLRPESIAVGQIGPEGSVSAEVVGRRFYGHDQMLVLRLPSGQTVRARRLGFPAWHEGDHVSAWIEGPADVLPRGDAAAR